ncbi:MAG: SMC-Scp complex subunit ScpB [Verrucomicrobia bacterium RIFCSPLOWO2_12_FULL_64_8]|nr:MAG: SMC-Scp complex subunit ScpB [Verrucomicrobia bacterium RIFCSPLOWO2_12_FULL_64_8]
MAFDLKRVLKALLFSSSRPLPVKEIQAVFERFYEQGSLLPENGTGDGAVGAGEGVEESPAGAGLYHDVPSLITTAQIRETMDEIARDLRATDDVYLLIEGAQGYRVVTRPHYARWVRLLRNEPAPVKLSQSALETLAVIAYRQPVTRAEIEHIRGVSAEAGLNKLLERELIYIVGRAELPGRPIQYGTTDGFLEYLGIKSLDELPASDVLSHRQIDEWLQNAMTSRHPSDREMGLAEEGDEPAAPRPDAPAAGAAAPGAGRPEATSSP